MKFSRWIAAVVAALLALLGSVFVVSEGQTAIVLNLGSVVRSDIGPGLHFKWPLVETARVFDRRMQVARRRAGALPHLRAQGRQRRLLRGRPHRGRARVLPRHRRRRGQSPIQRLTPIIKDALRNEINSRTLQQVVSGDRAEIVGAQLDGHQQGRRDARRAHRRPAHQAASTCRPTAKSSATSTDRMRAQRQQVASHLRAEGEEQAAQPSAPRPTATAR